MKKQKQQKPKKVTRICICIDRSGSMSSCHAKTVEGINEQIATLRKAGDSGGETRVTLIQFDDSIDTIAADKKPMDLKEWSMADFNPRGSTRLLDATFEGIRHLEKFELGEEDANLLIVISDGGENASRDITKEALTEKIQNLNKNNHWTISYITPDSNIAYVKSMGVSGGNISTWNVNNASVSYTANSAAVNSFMTMRSAGVTNTKGFYSNSSTTTDIDSEE